MAVTGDRSNSTVEASGLRESLSCRTDRTPQVEKRPMMERRIGHNLTMFLPTVVLTTEDKQMVTEIWGHDVMPQVGRYVKPDGWAYGECLSKGDNFSTFRLPLSIDGPIKSLAVEIEVTGRTLQRREGESGWVRVKVTFPGDCEPDTVVRGYMKVW